MKKRLRKKKHLGEFVEWGVPITIVRRDQDNFDRFLDAFLEQAIEKNNCYFGGGGKEDDLEGIIELGKTADRPAEISEQGDRQIILFISITREESHILSIQRLRKNTRK